MAIGDLNGDGKPDLAVANEGSNTVSVLLNTTAPGSTTPTFATQADLRRRVESPLRGDRRPERRRQARPGRRQPRFEHRVGAAEHDGAGFDPPSFAAQATFAVGSNPISVAIGDLNGDGKPDLAVANRYSGTVSVLLNTALTGIALPRSPPRAPSPSASIPWSVAIGDLNGDGKPDLAVANYGSGIVSVLLNTTAPGSTTATFAAKRPSPSASGPRSVAIGDLNGDGKPDLAVANEASGTVSVLLNTTTPGSTTASFAAQQTFAVGSAPKSVAIGDLNGDGKPDLAVANYYVTRAPSRCC